MTKRTLAIIPAYNEALNISRVVSGIKNAAPDIDILVVNDASKDDTSQKAVKAGAMVIDLPVNLGIGGAVQTGYKYAKMNDYDIAVQIDGDGQHDIKYLNDLIGPIMRDQADMVIGSRFINNEGFQSTFFRRLGIKYFGKLISILGRSNFIDVTSGFRSCNRRIISEFCRYYPVDYPEPESLFSLNRKRYRIIEVPVVMNERSAGVSSINSLKSAYYAIKVTLAILIDMFKRN